MIASPFWFIFFVSEKNYPQLIPLEDNFNRRVFIKLFIESNWSFILSCRTNNEHFNCIEFLGEGRERGQEKILWSLGKKLFAYFVEILIHFKCSKKKRKETLIFEESEYSRIEMDDLFVNFQNKIRYTVYIIVFVIILPLLRMEKKNLLILTTTLQKWFQNDIQFFPKVGEIERRQRIGRGRELEQVVIGGSSVWIQV